MIEIDIIHALSTLPATDGNFISELKKATPNQIRLAIERMESEDGQHKTRIAACKRELKKRAVPEKKQTNADRIRGMTDKELAIFLTANDFCCEYSCPAKIDGCFGNCFATITKWLQKEVE